MATLAGEPPLAPLAPTFPAAVREVSLVSYTRIERGGPACKGGGAGRGRSASGIRFRARRVLIDTSPLSLPPTQAATWETLAPLDDDDETSVAAVATALAEARAPPPPGRSSSNQPTLPPPAHALLGRRASLDTGGGEPSSASDPPLPSIAALDAAVLANVAEFDRWWAAVQAARSAEAEGSHTRHAAALAARAAAVGRLADEAAQADATLDRLAAAHGEVAARAAALRGAAGELVAVRERAAARRAALASRLAAFDELEAVTAALAAAEGGAGPPPSSARPALDDAGLVAALGRAADALAALTARPHYLDAAPYAARLRAALARGAALVRARAGGVLAAATRAAGAGGGGGEGGGAPATDDEAVSNLRFRAVAEPGLAPLLAGVCARVGAAAAPSSSSSSASAAGAPEFGALLADVRASYCGARLASVAPRLRARMEAAAANAAGRPAALAAAGSAALAGVAAQEVSLYQAIFGPALRAGAGGGGGGGSAAAAPPSTAAADAADAAAAADLSALIDPLATLLYDALRPSVVRLASVDDLVDVVAALRAASSSSSATPPPPEAAAAPAAPLVPPAARAAAAEALRPVLALAVADAQERLAFRVQAYVKEQVTGFVPGEADLDYPGLVERGAGGEGGGGGGGGRAGAPGPPPPPSASSSSPSKWALSAALYPPCARAADVLDATVGALAPSVFAGLAQDAVCGAAGAVAAGAPAVARRASPADGHLFAVRSLMGLRSRLAALGGPDMTAPPDTDVQFDLDFAYVRDRMLHLLGAGDGGGGGGSGWGGGSQRGSPAVGGAAPPTPHTFASTPRSVSSALAASLAPRSSRRRVDGARELDAALRGACEAAIMAATRAVADPLLSLITKATAARVAAALAGGGGRGGASAPTVRLRDHAFAVPDRVAAAVAAARAAAAAELPRFAAKAALYIPDRGARAALLRPVRVNLAEAFAQVAALLEAEYEGGEGGRVGMPTPEELAGWLAVLDA